MLFSITVPHTALNIKHQSLVCLRSKIHRMYAYARTEIGVGGDDGPTAVVHSLAHHVLAEQT